MPAISVPQRLCAACGRALVGRVSGTKYCDNTCRSKAFRTGRRALVADARELLAEPTPNRHDDVDPETLTAALATAPSWKDRLQRVVTRRPDILDALGLPALTAAARPLPVGTCRHCVARSYATVHELPPPSSEHGLMDLLGAPCPICTERIRADLNARVDAARPRARKAVTASAAVFTGPRTTQHGAECSTCRTAKVATVQVYDLRAARKPVPGGLYDTARAGLTDHRVSP